MVQIYLNGWHGLIQMISFCDTQKTKQTQTLPRHVKSKQKGPLECYAFPLHQVTERKKSDSELGL